MKHLLVLVFLILAGVPSLLAQGNPYPPNSPMSAEKSAAIEGQVSLANGNPAANVYLKLQSEGVGGLVQSASTDTSGSFSFTGSGISQGQNYVITASMPGYQPVHKLVMVTGSLAYVNIVLTPASGSKPALSPIASKRAANMPPKALEQYEKGLRSLDQGKKSDAEKAFKKAIQIYPNYGDSYLRLSLIYADQSRFPEAEKAIDHAAKIEKSFQKTIEKTPNNWFAQLELGRLFYDRKDYAGALPHFELARKLHPQAASTHLMLYDDLIHLGKYKEALTALDDFVAHFPRNPQAARMRKVRKALAAAAAKEH
jgi:tetratricopeptide (TPR) repeat protein